MVIGQIFEHFPTLAHLYFFGICLECRRIHAVGYDHPLGFARGSARKNYVGGFVVARLRHGLCNVCGNVFQKPVHVARSHVAFAQRYFGIENYHTLQRGACAVKSCSHGVLLAFSRKQKAGFGDFCNGFKSLPTCTRKYGHNNHTCLIRCQTYVNVFRHVFGKHHDSVATIYACHEHGIAKAANHTVHV